MIIFRKQSKPKIYMLRCIENGIKAINLPDSFIKFYINHQEEKAVKSLNNKKLGWLKEEDYDDEQEYNKDAPISDCPFVYGAIPVFSEKKFKLPTKDCVTSKFDVSGERYIAVVAPEIEGILNIRSSKISKFRDGGIMNVEGYIFNNLPEYPNLFRLKEYPVFTFCTEDVKKNLELSGFKFLKFIEVKVK